MLRIKNPQYVLVILLIFSQLCFAQDSVRVITGVSGEKEYIINEAKYNRILNRLISFDILHKRLELMKEQNTILVYKTFLADSALKISTLESQFWYSKLQENDRILEQERIEAASIWNSKTFWFVVGAVTASVVISAN